MYYLEVLFHPLQYAKIGRIVAGLFAVTCIGGALAAAMFQSNQVFQQVVHATGGERKLLGRKWLDVWPCFGRTHGACNTWRAEFNCGRGRKINTDNGDILYRLWISRIGGEL